jgi:hypothetical protein
MSQQEADAGMAKASRAAHAAEGYAPERCADRVAQKRE